MNERAALIYICAVARLHCGCRLEAQLEEALAQRDPVHRPAIDIDTPADKTLKLLDKIMRGLEVSAREAIELRDAIVQAGDLRQPVNFNEQLMRNSQTVLDNEVSQSLIQLLSSRRPAKVGGEMAPGLGQYVFRKPHVCRVEGEGALARPRAYAFEGCASSRCVDASAWFVEPGRDGTCNPHPHMLHLRRRWPRWCLGMTRGMLPALQIVEEDEIELAEASGTDAEGRLTSAGPSPAAQYTRTATAGRAAQDSVKALIALQKNLPDQVRRAERQAVRQAVGG